MLAVREAPNQMIMQTALLQNICQQLGEMLPGAQSRQLLGDTVPVHQAMEDMQCFILGS